MRTVYIDDSTQGVKLGFRQEHDYTEIVYTLPSDWEGIVEAFIKKPGATASVPLTGVTQADGTVSFFLTRTDLIEAGRGAIEYMCTMNGVVAKSKVFPVIIAADIISESTDRPDEWESWIDELTQLAAQVRTLALGAAASATSASGSASSASQSASGAAQSAQSASELAGSAERSAQSASDSAADAEEAKQTILNMTATATTLPEGSEATVDYSNGVMAFGIPKGDTGARGAKGDTGETGATPQMSIGTVETLDPDEDASVTIRGTAEAPILDFGLPKGETGEVSLLELIANTKVDEKTDSVPYQMRTLSGVGSHESLRKIVGGTVCWNQLLDGTRTSLTMNGITFTVVADGVVTMDGTATDTARYDLGTRVDYKKGHKYAVIGAPQGGSASTYRAVITGYNYTDGIVAFSADDYYTPRVEVYEGTTINNVKFSPRLNDLTQMFGTSVADAIYAMEQSTAGSGVAYLKAVAPKLFAQYNPYNEGELMSVSGLISHDTVGFNQWDEEWENGDIRASDGVDDPNSTMIRTKNYIPILPDTTYYCYVGNASYGTNNLRTRYYDANKNYVGTGASAYPNRTFIVPSNARYLRFSLFPAYGTTYKNDICINISSDRNGQYEPYIKHSYALDDSLTLMGMPKWDNGLKFDGDIYPPSGEVQSRYDIVDLGTLNWTRETGFFNSASFYANVSNALGRFNTYGTTQICSKYVSTDISDPSRVPDKSCRFGGNSVNINVFDSAFADMTAEQVKTALNGVYMVYEKATPTTETASPYTEIQSVESGGTEEFVGAEIPVGHESVYPRTLADTMPTQDGSYTLALTVSGGKPSVEWEVNA